MHAHVCLRMCSCVRVRARIRACVDACVRVRACADVCVRMRAHVRAQSCATTLGKSLFDAGSVFFLNILEHADGKRRGPMPI